MWALYSMIASILWGLDYTLTEKVLGKIRFSTLLSIELFFGFLVMLALTLASGAYINDVAVLLHSRKTLIYTFLIVLVFNIANMFIVLSIGNRNATLAGLIEISYPLFIVAFSWFFFKENNMNVGTVVGGAMIFTGVLLIYLFNK